MRGQKVPGLSESDIESTALRFRNLIGVAGPIKSVKIIEFVLPKIFKEFNFEVMDDQKLGTDFARTWPDQLLMHISSSVYEGAWQNDGACNHILAHEIGHLLLHKNVDPSFALAKDKPKYDCMFNSEWQADTCADFLLMPTLDLKATCVSVEEVQKRYCVSKAAAERRFGKIFGKKKGQSQLAFDFLRKD